MNITAPHNLDLYNNATTLFGFATASNTAVGNILGVVILFLSFVVPFIALKNYDTKVVFLTASSTSTITGLLLLTPLQWIDINIFFFPVLLLVASVIILLFSKE